MAQTNEKWVLRDRTDKLGEIFLLCFQFRTLKALNQTYFTPIHAHLPNKYVFLGPNSLISLKYENWTKVELLGWQSRSYFLIRYQCRTLNTPNQTYFAKISLTKTQVYSMDAYIGTCRCKLVSAHVTRLVNFLKCRNTWQMRYSENQLSTSSVIWGRPQKCCVCSENFLMNFFKVDLFKTSAKGTKFHRLKAWPHQRYMAVKGNLQIQ